MVCVQYTVFILQMYSKCVPYCLELRPGHLFLSSNFLPWLLNETGDYTRPAFIYLISIHKSTSYLGVVLSWTLLDVSLSIFYRFKLKGTL